MTSSRARAGPARSASRCVPPMAGVRPTTVSTSPKRADSAASSRSQASESSKAAVRHSAWAANTVGKRQLLDGVDHLRAARSTARPASCGAEAVEEVHVDAAADHAPLGAHEQAARRVGRDVGDGRLQGGDHRGVEEVQRRRVEGQDRERPVALEAHRLAHQRAQRRARGGDLVGVARARAPTAGAAGRRGSAGSRGRGSGRRSATPPSRRSSGGSRRRRRGRPWRARRGAWPPRRTPTGPPRRSPSRSVGVLARDDERVPAGGRVDVHERDGALVLGHDRRGQLPGDDLAEQAVLAGSAHSAGMAERASRAASRQACARPLDPRNWPSDG